MITVLAANDFGDDLGDGVAGPVGLLIIVLLVIALIFLMRSMNKHLRRVRDDFPDDETVARMRAEALSSGSSRAGGRARRTVTPATNGDGGVTNGGAPYDVRRDAAADPNGQAGGGGESSDPGAR
jgi:hypothetical protein